MRVNFSIVLILLFSFYDKAFAQVTSPENFLGYQIGAKFTYVHKVVDYFDLIAFQSPYMSIEKYGESYEGRPLMIAYISSPANLDNLDKILSSNRSRALLEKNEILEDQPIFIWLSYNVHGNEAVSVETAMKTLYEIVSKAETEYREWLEKAIIIIDPCLNPDGHTRYVQFYHERMGNKPNAHLFTREHQEVWPGGRPNHYLFDLNRDWAWQTQKESRNRAELFNRWMPHVHVDFHEMGINEPYYFAPSAEPIHSDFSDWLRVFQNIVGKRIGESFDKNHWLYFKGEWFDLLYPSYGDTYPALNGSVGMTFEQGGSGRAGLAGINREGDTITLSKRIEHHFVAGLKTIEASIDSYEALLKNFEDFFFNANSKPKGEYHSYVVKNDNRDRVVQLESYLTRNEIRFGYLHSDQKKRNLYSYNAGEIRKVALDRGDIIIPAAQPKGVLLKVLFEHDTYLSDSNTYDITAWALPYAMGLNAFASESSIVFRDDKPDMESNTLSDSSTNYVAYALRWQSLEDAVFLAAVLGEDVQPRVLHQPMKIEGKEFERGTLVFTKAKHEVKRRDFDETLVRLAKKHNRNLIGLNSGYSDAGPSFGSAYLNKLSSPHVGLLSGEGTRPTSIGEIWHFFETELGYPISIFERNQLSERVLKELEVIILTGLGKNALKENELKMISKWVEDGGKLIAMEDAVAVLADSDFFKVSMKVQKEEEKEATEILKIKKYSDINSENITNSNPGAIVRVTLDNTHPLAYGYGEEYFTLKTNNNLLKGLENGWNVGVCSDYPVMSGFVGKKFQAKMNNFMMMGVENHGSGKIVYFSDNPIFRSFWHAGKLMVCNAVFMVQ